MYSARLNHILAAIGSAALFVACQSQPSAQDVPDWENLDVLSINKEPPHATLFPFESRDLALQRDKTYVLERQLKLEASFFTPNRGWSFNLGLDANSIKDPIGDEFQWFTASAGYATDSWWLPGVRFGYRQNLAGTELRYLGVGVTAFRILNIDIASAFDRVNIDGKDLPQGLIASIGFDISF